MHGQLHELSRFLLLLLAAQLRRQGRCCLPPRRQGVLLLLLLLLLLTMSPTPVAIEEATIYHFLLKLFSIHA